MKYWEALIKGSKLRPQAFTQMYDGSGSCAIGAMYEGMFGSTALERFNGADAWSLVNELSYKFGRHDCPVCKVTWELGNLVWHLNDIHQWSRENVGYFLRSVEEKKEKMVEEPVKIEEKKHELVGA